MTRAFGVEDGEDFTKLRVNRRRLFG